MTSRADLFVEGACHPSEAAVPFGFGEESEFFLLFNGKKPGFIFNDNGYVEAGRFDELECIVQPYGIFFVHPKAFGKPRREYKSAFKISIAFSCRRNAGIDFADRNSGLHIEKRNDPRIRDCEGDRVWL